ncbi:MAG: WD40 repeat domain-containing protein [Verrucomicrobiales bacterium]|nr:WD40 repeat domain-containing protein [Verrucomicrobiales bacterium]
MTLAEDDSIRLWRVSDGVEQDSRTAEPLPGAGPAAIVDIGFDENRTMAAVTTEARASYLWDLAASGRPWTKFGFEAQHEVAAISSRARRFATGCKTGEVVVWDIDQPALPPRVWKLRIPVKRLAWNGEGRFLVAGLGSGEVVRVSTSDGDPPVRLGSLVGGINVVRVVGVSGGEWVFAASQGGECRMWSLSTGAAVSEVFPHPHPVYCAAVLPGADWVITGCNDGAARRWRCRWPSDGDSELGPFAEALGEGDHETVFRRRELVDRVRALLGPARGGGVVP